MRVVGDLKPYNSD